MIRVMIDFALRNRLMVSGRSAGAVRVGIISFHNLPIEAYPDVADTYAQIIHAMAGTCGGGGRAADHVPLESRVERRGGISRTCGRCRCQGCL